MATTIYMMRHGESEANERDVFLGHGDLKLTQRGREQASMTAAFLKNEIGRPDAVYSSDLLRAYETGKCTADQFDMQVVKDKELREIDAGKWDFLTFSQLENEFAESYYVWTHNIGQARCDGGESVEQLQNRVACAVERIAKRHDNQVVFIFSHATPIRAFAAYCLKKTRDEIKDVPWAANASVTKVTYHEGTFQLEEYSRDDFMGDLVTALPENV